MTLLNLIFWPLGFAVLVYWCRYLILVPRAFDVGQHRLQKPCPERATTVSSQVIGWRSSCLACGCWPG